MKYAYHIHTYLCNHADGPIRPYVENAVKAGYSTIAFSDHSPQVYSDGHDSSVKMLPAQLPDYMKELTALREEFADRITIRIGLEAEYYPRFFPALCDLCDANAVEFLFLWQHYLKNEVDVPCAIWDMEDDPADIWQYVNQVIEGLETGRFAMLAHPDVPSFTGDENEYRAAMTKLCLRAQELNVPLEYNLNGLRGHRHYPSDRFFRIAAEVGNTVALVVDAHSPDVLLDTESIQRAQNNLKNLGIAPVDEIPLRPFYPERFRPAKSAE